MVEQRSKSCRIKMSVSAALCASAHLILVGPASAEEAPDIDWDAAVAAFVSAGNDAPTVYTRKDAARCTARWMLHADVIDEGLLPEGARDALIEPLWLPSSLSSAAFFRLEVRHGPAHLEATEEAAKLLGKAFKGDQRAARRYFENLGECYSEPEAVRDEPEGAMDSAAEGPADAPAEG